MTLRVRAGGLHVRLGATIMSILLVACCAGWAKPGVAYAAGTGSVSISVNSIDPYTPARTRSKLPVTFTLTLTNTSSVPLTNVIVTAQRGNPITTQTALGPESTAPTTTGYNGPTIAPTRTVKASIPAGGSTETTFTTTASIVVGKGICECHNAVYPILFAASLKSAPDQVLGRGGTYLPVTYSAVHRVRVAWLWPLIDQPHRLIDDNVFTDDSLTSEVSDGGRLDRALRVIENVGSDVPVTLVIDPELIDELAVMAAGSYRVQNGTGTVTGTGTAAAATWLSRLHSVITADSLLRVALTPYADPDLQSLAVHHRTWDPTMPSAMADRVHRALDGATYVDGLSWPLNGAVTRSTLPALVRHGTTGLVVSSTGLSTGLAKDQPTPGVVTLHTGSTQVPALVTSARLEQLVTQGVTVGDDSTLVLPRLLAELTIRSTQNPSSSAQAVLAAPRYVDPNVAAATAIIESSSSSTYTTSSEATQLLATTRAPAAQLPKKLSTPSALPQVVLDSAQTALRALGTIRSLLTSASGSAAARTLVGALPLAVQRIESSAWSSRSGVGSQVGSTDAAVLSSRIDKLRNGVYLVPPSSGSYTLASGNSALPVTVSNTLRYPVTVDASLATVGGLPGLDDTRPILSRTIPKQSRVILHIPASAQRSGRLRVRVILSAPNGVALGSPLILNVRSTELGTLGIVIMVAASILLVLALARRWFRSMRHRRSRNPREVERS